MGCDGVWENDMVRAFVCSVRESEAWHSQTVQCVTRQKVVSCGPSKMCTQL